jgi:hypothetical protein
MSVHLDRIFEREIQRLENPHFCTVALEKFLKKHGCFREGNEILDMGSGIGAPIHYYYKKNTECRFLGVDHREDCIFAGNEEAKKRGASGISLEQVDWDNLPQDFTSRFDGIISTHSLCCLKHIEDGFLPMFDLKPRWIGVNSLFYEGPLDVLIHIRRLNDLEYGDDNPDGDFNIFSLEKTAELCAQHGYKFYFEPFFPPESIPEREDRDRGTFTMPTKIHERTQFSGPVHLPWYFVLAIKE